MKKMLALLLTFSLLLACSASGCAMEMKKDEGVLIDQSYVSGRISAFVPEGWGARPGEYGSAFSMEDYAFFWIIKDYDEENEVTQWNTPRISIQYYPDRVGDNYVGGEDRADVKPFILGEYEWSGITYVSWGTKNYRLYTLGDFGMILVEVAVEADDEKAATILEDAEVQEIIKSITVKAKGE